MIIDRLIVVEPGLIEVERTDLDDSLQPWEVLVETEYSVISAGTEGAGFGDLPRVDHEILAQDGQIAGRPGFDEVVFVTLKIGSIGQDRETGSSASRVGAGMRGRLKIFSNQSLGRGSFLDFRN